MGGDGFVRSYFIHCTQILWNLFASLKGHQKIVVKDLVITERFSITLSPNTFFCIFTDVSNCHKGIHVCIMNYTVDSVPLPYHQTTHTEILLLQQLFLG